MFSYLYEWGQTGEAGALRIGEAQHRLGARIFRGGGRTAGRMAGSLGCWPDMPIRDPLELAALLAPGQRLLGLDLGSKTIGVALSDPLLMTATPLETLKRGRFRDDAAALQAMRLKYGVGAMVIGMPYNMDGGEGPRAQATRAFARNLIGIDDPVIVFWDERLSTAAVTRGMIAADLSRKRRAAMVDRAAAAYILQGVLDRLAWAKRSAGTAEENA